ncbi:hypothetical protein HZ989_00255 [Brevundimonas sp. AJA228-03]|uniref:hypothetical protein n=1 Tax=Brevundimonas sp. AJA228-03 TaxID=2752515 RepID=UPI001AE073CC|nr:hypothetical protein [Brevundimonas sp. AJA228-03]QTN19562.1 hypothetical protein HZ989_00255 [Brevundimonas sp. AJA228-03]
MSPAIKIAVLSAVTLLGLDVVVPTPVAASPMIVQSRAQDLMDRSRRRQARLAEDRRFAEEEARMAAEAQAEAARRARAEAQATTASPAAEPDQAGSDETGDEAQTPAPQV